MTDRTDGADDARDERTRMRDVSHTPPHGDGTNEVWSRGDADEEPPVRGSDDDE